MIALRKLKMKQNTALLDTKQEVSVVFDTMRQRTQERLKELANLKRKCLELSHSIYLD